MASTTFKVFEHQRIRYPKGKHHCPWFKKKHYEAFAAYHNKNENTPFFELIDRGVKFTSYVGAIRIGNTTIEVLPKADKESGNEEKWQKVLLDMLKTCHLLHAKQSGEANLKLKSNSIFELYFELFVNEVEQLLRRGLIKKYRKKEGNRTALKGALVFSKHLTQNLIHKERFYVRYTDYNKNHQLHQILHEALIAIQQLNTSSFLSDRIGRLLLHFPEVNRIKVNSKTFEKINYNRKNTPYKLALQIAELILLKYRPDIRSGSRDLIAIMFDMNVLWEEYVYRILKKYSNYNGHKLKVYGQRKKEFWNRMNLKPDVIIEDSENKYILDTKWKLVNNNRPDDGDIKQMFSYNHLWKAKSSILLYPGNPKNDLKAAEFKAKLFVEEEIDHTCQLGFVNVQESISNKENFAKAIFEKIIA
jgi:5-methylcytosine-specific restriction enzyme subunit McrC